MTSRNRQQRSEAKATEKRLAFAFFGVSMRVHKNGDVEMLDDDPLGRIFRLH